MDGEPEQSSSGSLRMRRKEFAALKAESLEEGPEGKGERLCSCLLWLIEPRRATDATNETSRRLESNFRTEESLVHQSLYTWNRDKM